MIIGRSTTGATASPQGSAAESPPPDPAGDRSRDSDLCLVLLVGGAAFALGCQEMVDSDVWWHVRAGRWIWEHRRVPGLDPFSFASADRAWVDLHWLFQLILAAAHGAGGATGMIVLAAGLCAVVAAVGVTAGDRRSPTWLAAACWLPALVLMSARFAPRPELISLLAMAVHLAILQRADCRPAWLWLLPAVQVIWVNAHGLFVLGPILLGLALADRVATRRQRPIGKGEWRRLAGVAAAVAVACLANPYGLRGALLPLELFPKITAWGGLYKSYIVEFMDLHEFVARQGTSVAAANLYNRVECFLLWMTPMSWIVPSAWRAGRGGAEPRAAAIVAVAGLVLAVALAMAGAIGLPGQGTPRRLVELGRMAPIGLALTGALAAGLAVRSSPRAALIAIVGGLASAAWMAWLRAYLFGPEPGPAAWLHVPGRGMAPMAWAAGLLGIAAAGLSVVAGARPFRIGLAAAFGYLALQAIRNANLFGLAAGFVLAGNLGEWAAELAASSPRGRSRSSRDLATGRTGSLPAPRRGRPRAGLAARAIVAVAAMLLIAATVLGGLFRATGERRAFGLSASPLAYAHEAARFAGRPGLPEHAIVYSLRQAGVYTYHNGPGRKVFLDGRLEVPRPETFETYVRLERQLGEGRPGWSEALRQLGDPLVLLDHEPHPGAEATLLTDPGWRCLHYDGVASVFVSRRRPLGGDFPRVDFLARHFDDPGWRAVPARPWGLAEGQALLRVASILRRRPGTSWATRASLLLPACARLRQAVASDPAAKSRSAGWALLGEALEELASDPATPPAIPGPDEPWDPARSLLPAQATTCDRRALEGDPGEIRALFALYRSFGARRMGDARAAIAAMMRRAWAGAVLGDPDADAGPGPDPDPAPRSAGVGSPPGPTRDDEKDSVEAISARIDTGHPEEAVRRFEEAERAGIVLAWPTRDRVAAALLHLGRPAAARAAWLGAVDPPSHARRLARLAAAAMAAFDFPGALRDYRAALGSQPDLGEAWFGLALLHTQLGERAEARSACRAGLKARLTADQRAFLLALDRLLEAPGCGSP